MRYQFNDTVFYRRNVVPGRPDPPIFIVQDFRVIAGRVYYGLWDQENGSAHLACEDELMACNMAWDRKTS